MTQLLAKKADRLQVAKAMGQPTEAPRGPAITKIPGASTVFDLGTMTPKQWRAKRAAGWDPTKEFPLASEA
ncbi:hypothetical protein [Polyangium sp. 6x1]|uniref:hypothetical protein n=1 Tax=Polyangium sp. 6x1 TaxID=3042689 RepID=UPI002482E3B1|nr:hypothetical protein [Polyangium sp. 6x1]MDI1444211.1 hypothetical protein [Polyangium sp. 6x1]